MRVAVEGLSRGVRQRHSEHRPDPSTCSKRPLVPLNRPCQLPVAVAVPLAEYRSTGRCAWVDRDGD